MNCKLSTAVTLGKLLLTVVIGKNYEFNQLSEYWNNGDTM
jgi:hypothetical protein